MFVTLNICVILDGCFSIDMDSSKPEWKELENSELEGKTHWNERSLTILENSLITSRSQSFEGRLARTLLNIYEYDLDQPQKGWKKKNAMKMMRSIDIRK